MNDRVNSFNYSAGQLRTMAAMNPPKRNRCCEHIMRVAQLVKDTTGSGNGYSDTHLECTKLKKRITRKHCRGCIFYHVLINEKNVE